MKKVLTFLLAVATALGVLSGCGGGSEDQGTVIKVWCEAIGSDAAIMEQFKSYFDSNNGMGYTLEYELKDSLSGDLRAAIQAGKVPDIVIWPRWETMTRNNLLQEIDALVERDNIDMTKYNSEAVRELRAGGKLYGIPTDLDAWGIWCNTDLTGTENLPRTWEELKALTAQLTTGSGVNKVVGLDTYNLRGQFYTFMLTAGATFVNDGNPPTVNIDIDNPSSKSYQDAYAVLTLFEELMNITGTPSGYEQNEYFISGKVAMKFGPSNYNKTLKLLTQEDMNLKFIGNPAKSSTEGSISGILGGYSLAIPRGANAEKSWKVIKWWLEKDNIGRYCSLYELLPADTTLWNEDFVTSNVFLNDLKQIIPNYKVRPLVKGYSNFETSVVFSAMDELRLKTKTKDEVLRYIKTQGDDTFVLENML
jgi:multiple sugar transport system substrate-binding protein